MTIFSKVRGVIRNSIRTTNLAIIIGATFLLLVGIFAFLYYGYEYQTEELESVVSESRILATKMRYFSELAEAARTRTRLVSEILHTDDVFEQEKLNQKLEIFATKFATINQAVRKSPLNKDELKIREEQRFIITNVLPAQRYAVKLAMNENIADRKEAKRLLYKVVIPGQNELIKLFHNLILMQQKKIQELEKQSMLSLAKTKEQQGLVVNTTLCIFTIIIIFVIIRTRSIQLELEHSRELLETKVRERTAELMSSRDEAERSNQAKSKFLSSMSHELRTPLNAIIGFSQLLEYDTELDEEQQDNIHEIMKAGGHLLELINDVLDLAKIESGYVDILLEPVDLNVLVDECFSLISPVADKQNIKMSSTLAGYYIVKADKIRLKQVLLNLLSNAIKYNRENGSVELKVCSDETQKLRITISDTGLGIDKNKLKDLFQPFSRLDAETSNIEGTGIGLTITKRLVEMMGGTIGVDSQLGTGTDFWIELLQEPFSHDEPIVKETDIEKTKVTGEEKTVLYIEDNPANLKLVEQIFSKKEYVKLITAHESELGVELATIHQPDLILIDINMPRIDGYHVLRILHTDDTLADTPVIAITAEAMEKNIENGKRAGFNDYLTKPLDIPHFIDVVDQYLS